MVSLAKAAEGRGFTKAETAALFRVSERTLDRMIARGEVKVYRVGRDARLAVKGVYTDRLKAVSAKLSEALAADVAELWTCQSVVNSLGHVR